MKIYKDSKLTQKDCSYLVDIHKTRHAYNKLCDIQHKTDRYEYNESSMVLVEEDSTQFLGVFAMCEKSEISEQDI